MGQLYRRGQNLSAGGESIIRIKEYKDEPDFSGARVIIVGTDGQYQTIQDALNSIGVHGENHKTIIRVKPGVYDISDTDLPFLGILDYVEIIGDNKETCIVKNMKSSTTYNDIQNVFDISYYHDSIHFAKIANLTLINQGGKGCVHIDCGYGDFTKDGLVVLDNLICIDLNTPGMSGMTASLRTDDFGGGGINVGLRRYQHVRVTNCTANGSIYAHNSGYNDLDLNGGCTFTVENCTFGHSNIGDLGSGSRDLFIFKNNKFQRATINSNTYGSGAAAENYNITAIFENNQLDYMTGTDNGIGIDNTYGCFDRFFNGKFPFIENNIHVNVVNNSGYTVPRSRFAGLVNYNNKGESNIMGMGVRPFESGDVFAGYAMESINSGTMGIIQYNGVIRWSDAIVYPIGTYLKATGIGSVAVCEPNEADFKVKGNDGNNISFLKVLNPIM